MLGRGENADGSFKFAPDGRQQESGPLDRLLLLRLATDNKGEIVSRMNVALIQKREKSVADVQYGV